MIVPFYPGAHVDLLPEATTQLPIVPYQVILHTNAGSSSSTPAQLRAYMARADVTLECHFDVGSDGTVWQYMPINVRADCNAAANRFLDGGRWCGAVSIETQDNGGGSVDSTPWTPAQGSAIVGLLRWLHDEAGIPMQRITRWNGPGVGAHRDFPNWSSSAHSCPGNARFVQVPGLIAAASVPFDRKGEGEFMHVEDASDGKFWRIAVDATGALYARPLDECPRAGDWDVFGRINDKVNGPLTKIDHDWLQAMYDVQGKPNLPQNTELGEHQHHNIGLPTTTGGVVR